MTAVDFMNDYYFLEECIKFVKDKKHKKSIHKVYRGVSGKFQKLKKEALDRNTRLYFMVDELQKRKENQSEFDTFKHTIYWHCEFYFVNADNLMVTRKFSEKENLSDILLTFLNETENESLKKSLEFYKSSGIKKIDILLKAEGLKGSKFFKLDLHKTLKKNLTKKILIEYPVFYVVLNHMSGDFDIVDEDGEFKITFYQSVI